MFMLSLLKTIESIVWLEFAAQMLQGMLKKLRKTNCSGYENEFKMFLVICLGADD